MLLADLALGRRLEATDAAAGADFAQAYAQQHPASGATAIPVMGGTAIYAGVESPATQAFALGLHGAVTAAELDEMEEFYRSRGAAVNIELCPLADASLISLLNERGYRVLEFSQVLVRKLNEADKNFTGSSALQVWQTKPEEAETWGRTVARGFMENGDIPDFLLEMVTTSAGMPATTRFLAEVDGQIAGGGGATIHEGVASLWGASTLSAFRQRGVQTTLMQARLAFAVNAGCDLAMVTTMPGTISYRNAERQGFRVVYTRCKLTKRITDCGLQIAD